MSSICSPQTLGGSFVFRAFLWSFFHSCCAFAELRRRGSLCPICLCRWISSRTKNGKKCSSLPSPHNQYDRHRNVNSLSSYGQATNKDFFGARNYSVLFQWQTNHFNSFTGRLFPSLEYYFHFIPNQLPACGSFGVLFLLAQRFYLLIVSHRRWTSARQAFDSTWVVHNASERDGDQRSGNKYKPISERRWYSVQFFISRCYCIISASVIRQLISKWKLNSQAILP